jgi:hypothetical protein
MLRFILAVVLIAVLLNITRSNPYVGFGLYLVLATAFMIYAINTVDCEEIEERRRLLEDPRTAGKYYYTINFK